MQKIIIITAYMFVKFKLLIKKRELDDSEIEHLKCFIMIKSIVERKKRIE